MPISLIDPNNFFQVAQEKTAKGKALKTDSKFLLGLIQWDNVIGWFNFISINLCFQCFV